VPDDFLIFNCDVIWFDPPVPQVSFLDNFKSGAVVVLTALFGAGLGAGGTWLSIKWNRADEHARWRRDQLIEIGTRAVFLAQQKWDLVYYDKVISFDPNPIQKNIARGHIEGLPTRMALDDEVFYLRSRAEILSAQDLANKIKSLWDIRYPIGDKAVYETASNEIMGAKLELVKAACLAVRLS
jgi:hypothetical protein